MASIIAYWTQLMLAHRFALAFGLLCGLTATQAPEYAQQYRQRLGGALDELNRIVDDFALTAGKQGMTPAEAALGLEHNGDPIARDRGAAMLETMARRDRLAEQQARMAHAGSFGRLGALAQGFDPQIARGAWSAYEPAIPTTTEGLTVGGAGALAGYFFLRLIAAPFGRRRKPASARA
ncbi:MAG: DUF2937 family protein [Hyphomicrobiales bacterium]|nr:DUF2937 family protein [Hyphomicrobiales bacterium]